MNKEISITKGKMKTRPDGIYSKQMVRVDNLQIMDDTYQPDDETSFEIYIDGVFVVSGETPQQAFTKIKQKIIALKNLQDAIRKLPKE